jgi:hypothetical protein
MSIHGGIQPSHVRGCVKGKIVRSIYKLYTNTLYSQSDSLRRLSTMRLASFPSHQMNGYGFPISTMFSRDSMSLHCLSQRKDHRSVSFCQYTTSSTIYYMMWLSARKILQILLRILQVLLVGVLRNISSTTLLWMPLIYTILHWSWSLV